ncbi:GNAT family N-acetyltransferase [Lacimicrobium alkaliphilum]|uniref:N-acetyltransferase domain-containing protein n=1 Tax=Lacimicrobium alkaliphilum TaxID=1526571 RepID=A0ABQ1R1Q2_9ALTE|nr:GNAT family N-acetyltransferase [Lacimicrobium alkaliphilum]GGD54920.1 hypothetical protein GCM10011357_08310 [Lacimicrobium alkaliphilum]
MNTNQLKQANIDNLSALWQTLGSHSSKDSRGNRVHCSASWPHRCWSDFPVRLFPGAFLAPQSIVPVWQVGEQSREQEQALEEQGFTVAFEQQAMVLELNPPAECQTDNDITIINSEADIIVWTSIASAAFGYIIDPDVILRGNQAPNLQLMLGYAQQRPAVTALLYQTDDIVGVHQLGVTPEFRGKGLASKMMAALLGSDMVRRSKWMVLQASAAGEPMYRKLGFRPQFRIRNYQRQKP